MSTMSAISTMSTMSAMSAMSAMSTMSDMSAMSSKYVKQNTEISRLRGLALWAMSIMRPVFFAQRCPSSGHD